MSQHERTGTRDLTYSAWHRSRSTKRFLGAVRAAKLSMIDVDAVEFCFRCSKPLALIEVKDYHAQSLSMRVTLALADLAGIDAYLVLCWPTEAGDDIERFEVRPRSGQTVEMSPSEYAEWLWSFRDAHDC